MVRDTSLGHGIGGMAQTLNSQAARDPDGRSLVPPVVKRSDSIVNFTKGSRGKNYSWPIYAPKFLISPVFPASPMRLPLDFNRGMAHHLSIHSYVLCNDPMGVT